MHILILQIKTTMSIAFIYFFIIFFYFKGSFNVTDNTTKYYTSPCYNKETKSSRIHSLMLTVIGLTSVSFIIYIVYLYTRVLEKRQKNNSTFTG